MRTLREVDVVASEDTRVAASLLRHLGIERKRLVSHHDHNLARSVPRLVQMLAEQKLSVAVVSDAGTPGISDPGRALAAACAERGVPLVPVPGPCAAVAAVSIAGVGDGTDFVFGGFLARASKARRLKVAELAAEPRVVVLYEAPHRLLQTLGDLSSAGCGARPVVVARELTKVHEEVYRGTVASAYQKFGEVARGDGRIRGEFTLVLGPLDADARKAAQGAATDALMATAAAEVSARLRAGGKISKVAREVAAELGVPKRKVYDEALRQQQEARAARRGGGGGN